MRNLDLLRISFTALWRRKVRTFLTMFAVFIGVFIIIFLVSLSFGAQQILLSQITNQFDLKSIFVLKQGTLNLSFLNTTVKEDKETEVKLIDEDAIEAINSIENVSIVSPIISYSGRKFEFKDKNFDDRVVESARGAGWNLEPNDPVYGSALAGKVDSIANDEIVITKNITDAYNKPLNDFLGQIIILTDQPSIFGSQAKPMPPKEYKIVGVISSVRDFTYILNLDNAITDLSEKFGYATKEEYIKTAGYQTLYVKSNAEVNVKQIASEIKALGFDATTLDDVLTIFNTFFNIVPLIFTIVGLIAIFVASVGIINTMIMSVYERTREIGVMKAVGAANMTILKLFITEAGLIGFLGGIFAVITSVGVMAGMESLLINNILPKLEVTNITDIFITPTWLIIVTVVFSTLVGILAGIYPSLRASRLDPVDALRYE